VRRTLLTSLLLVLVGVPLGLACGGCRSLGVHDERVRVRRDPAVIAETERATRPLTPEEIEDVFRRDREAREVSPDLQRALDDRAETLRQVDAALAGIPRDPWRDEELDRRRVIVREWADIGRKPPQPDPLPEPKGEYADEQDGTAPLPSAKPADTGGEGGEGQGGDATENDASSSD
jgi:hypothetical protein